MLLTGTIYIEHDGSVSCYALDQPEKVPDYVASLLDRRVAAWQFEPTVHDGRAVAVRSPMSVRMVARPVGEDGFEVSISGANFGKGSYRATDYLTRALLYPQAYTPEAHRMGSKGTVYHEVQSGRNHRVVNLH